jgi:hypothetical protein
VCVVVTTTMKLECAMMVHVFESTVAMPTTRVCVQIWVCVIEFACSLVCVRVV